MSSILNESNTMQGGNTMPNIWTHMLFCEDLIDTIGNPNSFSKHEALMKLGAQGPDPFFYHHFWPWLKESHVNKIGSLLHTQECGPVIMEMIQKAKNKDKPVQAYVFGFVTHHILDRNAHPYINYRAGYEGSNHQKLEVCIDTTLMEKYHNLKTWKVPVYKEINVGRTMNKDAAQLLHHTIKTFFPALPFDNPCYIQKAYQDMKFALKLLADPYGWKNIFLKSFISSYSHQPIKDEVDYLNLNHTTWYHPATNTPSTDSFLDLYEQAKLEGIEIMSEVIRFWAGNEVTPNEQLQKLVGNISYDTGLPLKMKLTNQYCDPIV